MALITKQISTYRIFMYLETNFNLTTTLSDAGNLDFDHCINCVAADGKHVYLYFPTNRAVLPKHFINTNGNWYIFFKEDQYTYCLDLLRNETPVSAGLDLAAGKGGLHSGNEPVGEGPGEPV